MKDTTPPPSMTKEQQRELRELQKRVSKLDAVRAREVTRARRRIAAIQREIDAHKSRLFREAKTSLRALAKPLNAEERALRTRLHRMSEGRDAECKELLTIARRMAILEGRLAS